MRFELQEEDFQKEHFLYHYTKAESLIKILNTMYIKTSSFEKLNDLNEASIYNFNLIGYQNIFVDQLIKDKCRVFSFTRDTEKVKGFNHPGMWAYYADNNKGACIVIDEEKFRSINSELFMSNKDIWLENVEYTGEFGYEDIEKQLDNKEFIRLYYRKLFMTKHPDWEHECERRLVGINLPEYINIKGALRGVILGKKFIESNQINYLCAEITNPSSQAYKIITPFSFFECCNMLYDYLPYQASMVVNYLVRKAETANDYCEWFEEEYGR